MVKEWENTLFAVQLEHSFTMAMASYRKETLMSSPTIRSLENVGLNGDLYETATLVLPRLESEYPSDFLLQGNLRPPSSPSSHTTSRRRTGTTRTKVVAAADPSRHSLRSGDELSLILPSDACEAWTNAWVQARQGQGQVKDKHPDNREAAGIRSVTTSESDRVVVWREDGVERDARGDASGVAR